MLTFPPDITFVIQIASFFVLWLGLKRLLFDPVLRVLEEREARTRGFRAAAAEMTTAAGSSQTEYDHRIQQVRVALAADTDAFRAVTQQQQTQILAETRAQASAQLTQLRESLRREADAARPALASEARDLAGRIVERVVGRTLA